MGERRGPSRDGYADTDPSMRLSEFEDVVIELAETDMEDVEQTQVRARLARSPDLRPRHRRGSDSTPPAIASAKR